MGGGAAGLEQRGEWEDVWRGHCSPGFSGSKRQATSSPILSFKFLSRMVEDGVKGEGPRGELRQRALGDSPAAPALELDGCSEPLSLTPRRTPK